MKGHTDGEHIDQVEAVDRGIDLSRGAPLDFAGPGSGVVRRVRVHRPTCARGRTGAGRRRCRRDPPGDELDPQPGPSQYNIPTLPASPYHVPGDANCSDVDYVQGTAGPGQAVAPISAGAGLDLLKAQETAPAGQTGCLDIARSSSAPRGLAKDSARFEYYAFGLDAVSWASPSLQAPASMTLDTLQKIYNCTFTDWSQVPGGGAGPIQRYFTQVGSGTGTLLPVRPARRVRPDHGQHVHAAGARPSGGQRIQQSHGQPDRRHRLPERDPAVLGRRLDLPGQQPGQPDRRLPQRRPARRHHQRGQSVGQRRRLGRPRRRVAGQRHRGRRADPGEERQAEQPGPGFFPASGTCSTRSTACRRTTSTPAPSSRSTTSPPGPRAPSATTRSRALRASGSRRCRRPYPAGVAASTNLAGATCEVHQLTTCEPHARADCQRLPSANCRNSPPSAGAVPTRRDTVARSPVFQECDREQGFVLLATSDRSSARARWSSPWS